MAQDTLPITVKGKAALESELKKLLLEERPATIKAIEEARAHGDISENAEYDRRLSMNGGRPRLTFLMASSMLLICGRKSVSLSL